MKIRNFTPHEVNIIGDTETRSIPSEGSARVAVSETQTDTVNYNGIAIPVMSEKFGEVEGLPEPEYGVILIVSRLVKSALPNRTDCMVPSGLVRDDSGRIVGCTSLSS